VRIKLGELRPLPREWGRRKISLDHVRCLQNDLVNGAAFPPLLVDRNTRIIVGGNHRFLAYQKFYGDKWEEQEVEVSLMDLPPYEQNPLAWKKAILFDNFHLVERIRHEDRNKLAMDVLRLVGNPEAAQDVAEKLHFTREGWLEFARTYFEQAQKAEAGRPFKSVREDNVPGDVSAMDRAGKRARVLSKAGALLHELRSYAPAGLVPKEREIFRELVELLTSLLEIAETA